MEVGDWQAPGRKSREKPRLVKHQERPTRCLVVNSSDYPLFGRCEGTASYQYTDAVAEKYRPREGEHVLQRSISQHSVKEAFKFFFRLPEEGPMPQPAVGMRLSKWPDTEKY